MSAIYTQILEDLPVPVPAILNTSTAVYDFRTSWLSFTSAQFQFHGTKFHHSTSRVPLFRIQFHHQRPWNSSSIRTDRVLPYITSVPSSNLEIQVSRNSTEFRRLINRNSQIYHAGPLTQTLPGYFPEILCESVADLADFFSALWRNYLAPNLLKIWVPRNRTLSILESTDDLQTPFSSFVE